jgi:amino acid transporter
MAIRRIRKQPLLPSKFSLGRFGLAINLVSVGFLLLAFTMIFFPPGPNPDPQNMNWAILVYGAVVIFSLTYYIFRGRFRYAGPVERVRKMV